MKTSLLNTLNRQNWASNSLRFPLGLLLLVIMGLILAPAAEAQNSANELATLEIELWPDYDRPQVLVLLTGTLADDTPAPATVILPVPEEASINAVAHVNVASGNLENISEVDSDTPGQLIFTTPSPTFRIEYYMPYTLTGDRREVTFDWLSDMTIDQLFATVQQPADASDFELTPVADQSTTGQDGLIYHALGVRALPAGQSYSLTASYDLAGGQLSADVLATRQPEVQGPLPLVSDPAQAGRSDFDWPIVAIVAGGLIILAAVAWFLYTSSNSGRKRTPRPRPKRATSSRDSKASPQTSSAQFCHNCGQAVDDDDRFCRECGTPLKGR